MNRKRKDIRLNIKIKNNLILKRGEELYQTQNQSELARKIGISPTELGKFVNFKKSPTYFAIRKKVKENYIHGNIYWREEAIKIADILQCSPWEIFPKHLWKEKEKNQYNLEIDSSDLMLSFSDNETQLIESSSNPLKELEQKLAIKNIPKILSTITPREEKILRGRYGLDDGKTKSLEELSKIFHVTRGRIRQIQIKALRKLRHPRKRKMLEIFIEETI